MRRRGRERVTGCRKQRSTVRSRCVVGSRSRCPIIAFSPIGGLPPGEVAAILQGSTSLDSYAKKPDCFRRAASMLQTRCGDLETDENQRVRAAISMTLCEIATGEHASPPLECESFRSDSNDLYATHPPSDRKCVSALSRSAQYWSSYSGYLREVTQLCFAYQRWNDIDTAKEAHRNTTREAMNVLRYLADREKRMEQSYQDSTSMVASLQAVLEQIMASSATLDVTSAAASGTLRRVLDEVRLGTKTLWGSDKPIH
ncbi:hypothetical protein LXA43DRAFT_876046 [Ganoderma leucocontextum]|nr:hypothetical protein LXA43DRAFT_876046 [Ganoderma leucocontextum]